MTPLSNKRALVTGASRGIGRAIAEALAADGADVAITYQRSAEKAHDVVRTIEATGRRSIAIPADSADPTAVKNSVERAADFLGGLDILINNAGILVVGPLEDLQLEALDRVLHVNIRSVVLATQAALAHLPEGGRIINIGSNLADKVPAPGLSVYSMTKSALIALTKGLARDLGQRNITVNLVHPGPTDTDMSPADSAAADGVRKVIALGRYGTAQDVAAAVTFLAGPGAKHITGAELLVDGGINA